MTTYSAVACWVKNYSLSSNDIFMNLPVVSSCHGRKFSMISTNALESVQFHVQFVTRQHFVQKNVIFHWSGVIEPIVLVTDGQPLDMFGIDILFHQTFVFASFHVLWSFTFHFELKLNCVLFVECLIFFTFFAIGLAERKFSRVGSEGNETKAVGKHFILND